MLRFFDLSLRQQTLIVMNQTQAHRVLSDHVKYGKGTKTVCVSACLSYLGISPDTYSYTSSDRNIEAYVGVLRRNGYAVRSRATEFKLKKYASTLTEVRTNIKKSNYGKDDLFLISGIQRKKAHLMLFNGLGQVIIDTAPSMRWKVRSVKQVFKNKFAQ